jgi:hypothetical protein
VLPAIVELLNLYLALFNPEVEISFDSSFYTSRETFQIDIIYFKNKSLRLHKKRGHVLKF